MRLIELQDIIELHKIWYNENYGHNKPTGRSQSNYYSTKIEYLLSKCNEIIDQINETTDIDLDNIEEILKVDNFLNKYVCLIYLSGLAFLAGRNHDKFLRIKSINDKYNQYVNLIKALKEPASGNYPPNDIKLINNAYNQVFKNEIRDNKINQILN